MSKTKSRASPKKTEPLVGRKRRLSAEEEEGDDESDSEVIDENDEVEEEGGGQDDDSKSRDKKDKNSNVAVDDGRMSRIEMLQAKLRAKMAEKRAAAETGGTGATPASLVSKRTARRAEKKRKAAAVKEHSKRISVTSVLDSARLNMRLVTGAALRAKLEVSVALSEGISTIDYGAVSPKKNKSLELLLADAEGKQRRLKELKESADSEGKAPVNKMKFTRKSDPKKMSKAPLKHKAKKKASSAKTWKSRTTEVKSKTDKRQKSIHAQNLNTQKVEGSAGPNVGSNRISSQGGGGGKDGGKKGASGGMKMRRAGNRAGFEGKKQGFINRDSVRGTKSKGKQM